MNPNLKKSYSIFGLFLIGFLTGVLFSNHDYYGYYINSWMLDYPSPSMKSNDSLHRWAGSVIEKAWPDDKGGYYDMCFKRSLRARSNGELINPDGTVKIKLDGTGDHGTDFETNVDFEIYPPDVVNACAIILQGAEW